MSWRASRAEHRRSRRPAGDNRFRDPTWRENPAYHRLMQSYLAWSAEVQEVVDRASLELA